MSAKEKFIFSENDIVGENTLDVISEAEGFNKWMYKTIKTYCKGRVLEIGSGIGNISNFFLQDGFEILLTDIRTTYCEKLESSFKDQPSFLGATAMDLTDEAFEDKFKNYLNSYDTVFALNVVEHIFDDTLAIQNCQKLLKKGGRLIILVPSYQKLYNNFDKGLGHYRRYNKSSLSELFLKNNFEIIHKQYFNSMGIFGWYISGKLLKKQNIPRNHMRLYNVLVPIFKVIDICVFRTFGLSTIIVGRK